MFKFLNNKGYDQIMNLYLLLYKQRLVIRGQLIRGSLIIAEHMVHLHGGVTDKDQ